jgi:hypothetical protein
MKVNGTDPTVLSGLPDLLGGDVDIAFMVYAAQIQQMDGCIKDALEQVQQIQNARKAINDRLSELRDLKTQISDNGEGDGDQRHVTRLDYGDGTAQEYTENFSIGKDGSVQMTKGDPLGTAKINWIADGSGLYSPQSCHEITVADVDKEINRLTGMAQTWDNNREIQMLLMQGQLNKKEQAVTLLSNLIKKTNDTQSALINNLK